MELCIRNSTIVQTIEIDIKFEVLDQKYQDGVLKVERDLIVPQLIDFSPRIEIIHERNRAPDGQKCVKVGMKNIKEDFWVDFGNPDIPDPQFQNFEVIEAYKSSFNGEEVWANEKTYYPLEHKRIPRDENGMIYNAFVMKNNPKLKIRAVIGVITIKFEPDDHQVFLQTFHKEFSVLKIPIGEEDFTIVCEDEKVKFNRRFLANVSDVFATMLENSNMIESEKGIMKMENVSVDVLKTMKKMLCNGEIKAEYCNIDMLMFADRYNIRPLMTFCKDRIRCTINKENIIDIIRASDGLSDDSLLKYAADFMMENKGRFENDPEWNEYSNQFPEVFAKLLKMMMFK